MRHAVHHKLATAGQADAFGNHVNRGHHVEAHCTENVLLLTLYHCTVARVEEFATTSLFAFRLLLWLLELLLLLLNSLSLKLLHWLAIHLLRLVMTKSACALGKL